MTSAQYQVIKFVADPVRDEPLNIGLMMVTPAGPTVAVPQEALERAARWSASLDRNGFAALGTRLTGELERAFRRAEDLGGFRSEFLPDFVGAVVLSEPREIDIDEEQDDRGRIFEFLLDRLVMPPKQVVYGGGDAEAKKLAKSIGAAVKKVVPTAAMFEPVVGRSGRSYVADIFVGGSEPLVVSALVPSSGWQGVRLLEAKAFELYDIKRSIVGSHVAVCCQFPPLDPAGVKLAAEQIFATVDVSLTTPSGIAGLASQLARN